jgi:hypothetical protein
MPQNNPSLNQWQMRHQQALSAVKAAEARRDPQAIRQAYEQLRQINMAKPDGQAKPKGRMGNAPANAPARQKRGVLSTINDALRGALPQ